MRIKGNCKEIDIDIILAKFDKTINEFWNENSKEYSTENVKFSSKELEDD